LSKMGLISAVRTFLFSNLKFSGNIEPITLLLLSKSLLMYWFSMLSSPFRPFLYNWKTSCFFYNCFSFSLSSFTRFMILMVSFYWELIMTKSVLIIYKTVYSILVFSSIIFLKL